MHLFSIWESLAKPRAIYFQGLWRTIVCTWWRTLLTVTLKAKTRLLCTQSVWLCQASLAELFSLLLNYRKPICPRTIVFHHFLQNLLSLCSHDICRFGMWCPDKLWFVLKKGVDFSFSCRSHVTVRCDKIMFCNKVTCLLK